MSQMTQRTFQALTLVALASISEAKERGLPSGELYAMLAGRCSIGEYTAVIANLVKNGLITDTGHLLVATETGAALGAKLAYAMSAAADPGAAIRAAAVAGSAPDTTDADGTRRIHDDPTEKPR